MTTVRDLRTGEEADLALLLTSYQEQSRSGTLKLQGKDGQVKYVYMKRGTIELLKTSRSRTLLGKALLKRRKLTEEQLSAALERQRAAQNRLRLGEILVGMGIVLESDVQKALAYQIAEEVFELFSWGDASYEFFRGEPPLDIFETEDLQARVSLSPVQLTREAIRRQNELLELRRLVPSLKDVYAPTPRAYRPDAEHGPAVQELLGALDGRRNLEEALDVVRAPDLVALRVLAKMVQEGDAVALSAQDQLALGGELEEQGEFERARERFLRAEELGHADYELPRRIGQLAEALGHVPEACKRYLEYAVRCAKDGWLDVATITLARVLELDPGHHEARERHAELLTREARALEELGDPAAAGRLQAAVAQWEHLLAAAEGPEDRRRALTALLALDPGRHDLRERLAELSVELGDTAQAVLDLQELAMTALEAGEHARAVGVLERVLAIDPDDLLARQSLATTYARLGRKDDAVREYLRLAKTLEESGLASASAGSVVELYEKVIELEPTHGEARRFLARAYDDKQQADKAIAHYAQVVEGLRRQGDRRELLGALRKLSSLKPEDLALKLEAARLGLELGEEAPGLDSLKGLGEAALRQGDLELARKVLGEHLERQGGDLEAHLLLARVEAQGKDAAAAARRAAAVFELALLTGRNDLAEEAVKRALDHEPDRPEHRERLARVLVGKGRADEAARALVRAARRARDDENLGLAQGWARRALELDGTCDDARDLLETLKRPKTPVAAQPPAPAEEAPRAAGPTIAATITGGGKVASIEGFQTKTRRIGGIADRLRTMKGGGEPGSEAPAPPASVSKGPEAPGDAADPGVSKKASSAMNRLRALKTGGAPPTSGPPGGGEGHGGGDGAGAAGGAPPAGQAISKGPEAPGEAADPAVSKKATSALSRLKALKAGGAGAASGGPAEPVAAAAPPGAQAISKGPEAPGEAADPALSKKASSAMSRLRALKGATSGAADPPSGAS